MNFLNEDNSHRECRLKMKWTRMRDGQKKGSAPTPTHSREKMRYLFRKRGFGLLLRVNVDYYSVDFVCINFQKLINTYVTCEVKRPISIDSCVCDPVPVA